jgi:hypothetical protein
MPRELSAAAVLAVALVACSAAPAALPARLTPTLRPTPVPSCAWYTPTTEGGQQVIVAVTGPACGSHALIAWIADKSGKPWASTVLRIGTDTGTEFAVATRGGSTVRIFEEGTALATQATGGYLADDFQAAGWTVEPPGFQA